MDPKGYMYPSLGTPDLRHFLPNASNAKSETDAYNMALENSCTEATSRNYVYFMLLHPKSPQFSETVSFTLQKVLIFTFRF